MENQDAGYMTYSASIFFNEFSAWSNQSNIVQLSQADASSPFFRKHSSIIPGHVHETSERSIHAYEMCSFQWQLDITENKTQKVRVGRERRSEAPDLQENLLSDFRELERHRYITTTY
ncbi:hypothetical protein NC651_017259 [Populus alba x Populus x berolinensis]|nr:hypothetical protein NC651_017259 [Populus alba x Populus x berolinensis]